MGKRLLFGLLVLFAISFVNAGDISSCQTLSSSNTIYSLTQTVNSSGTCFTISAENVTLDCAGYTINFSVGGGANEYGVYSNQNYSKIYNCTIIDGNESAATSPNQGRTGIVFYNSNYGEIINNDLSVYGNTSNALSLISSSNNNLTSNSAISFSTFGGSAGIYISSSNYNTLTSNTGTSDFSRGIFLQTSSSNNLTLNTGISNSSVGILISSESSNNLLISNTGISNLNFHGISIHTSSNNTLVNDIGYSNSTSNGIFLYFSENNTLINITGTSNLSKGIYLYSSSNNTFFNINTSGLYGIYLNNNSKSNNFTGCVGVQGLTSDVHLETDSSNNIFVNCSYSTDSMNGTGNSLIRKWYIETIVNDSNNFLTNAIVNITNFSFARHVINSEGDVRLDTGVKILGTASAYFDGSNDLIKITDSSSLDFGSDNFTIDVWVRFPENFSNHTHPNDFNILDKGDYKMVFDRQSGKLRMEVNDNSSTSWTTSYNSASSEEQIRILAVYDGKLYAGEMGSSAADGNILVFDGSSWTTSYDGSQYGVHSLAVYDGKLYAGLGYDTLGTTNGDILVFDGSTWSVSYDGSQEQFNSLAVYDGKLYAGQGYGTGDGDIFGFDGTNWSLSYDGSQETIFALAVYDGKLYAGQGYGTGDGDVLVFDGSSWTTSYDSLVGEQLKGLSVYNGKLYASQGGSEGGVLVFDGSSWTTSYEGTQEVIYNLAVYDGKLYAGQGYGTGDGDIFVYGNNYILESTQTEWVADTWYHLAVTYDGIILRLFVNGILDNSLSQSFAVEDNNLSINLGGYGTAGEGTFPDDFYGYLDELRITKGIAKWTSNFTPPVEMESNLLLHFNGANASTNFIDDANVNVFNSLTNDSGRTNPYRFEATEYILNDTGYFYSTPHIVNISKSGYITNSTVYNLTSIGTSVLNSILFDIGTPSVWFSCSPSSTYVGQVITCVCSGADLGTGVDNVTIGDSTIDGLNHSIVFTATEIGNFTLNCTVVDNSNYIHSTTATYSVGTASNGGGTTLNTLFWKTVDFPTEEELELGYTKELEVKNRVRFKIENDYHFVGVESISNSTVIIEISSNPMQVALDVGEEAKIDVNSDGFYDVYVFLNGLIGDVVDLTVKRIYEEVIEEGIPISTTGEVVADEIVQMKKKVERGRIMVWALIMFMLSGAFAAAAVGISFSQRKN